MDGVQFFPGSICVSGFATPVVNCGTARITLINVAITNISVDTGLVATSYTGAVVHNQPTGTPASSGFLHITGSTFSSNTGTGAGAVLVRRAKTFQVSSSSFIANVLQQVINPGINGGAAFVANFVSESISLDGLIFSRNTVANTIIGEQSAAAFMSVVPPIVNLINTVFSDGFGVPLYILNTQPPTTYANLKNVIFTNNTGQ